MTVAPAYRFRAEILRVIDADTLVVRVDCGFRTHVDVELRLNGYNSPELNTPEGKAARGFVHDLLLGTPPVPQVVIESFKDRRTFARWVADVFVDGEPLGPLLVSAGHATPST